MPIPLICAALLAVLKRGSVSLSDGWHAHIQRPLRLLMARMTLTTRPWPRGTKRSCCAQLLGSALTDDLRVRSQGARTGHGMRRRQGARSHPRGAFSLFNSIQSGAEHDIDMTLQCAHAVGFLAVSCWGDKKVVRGCHEIGLLTPSFAQSLRNRLLACWSAMRTAKRTCSCSKAACAWPGSSPRVDDCR